jgi:hypothetical protein
MWRGLAGLFATVAIVYAYGYPVFNGYRPARLDRALLAFHAEVNGVARSGQATLAQLDRRRAHETLQLFINKVDSEISKK